MLLNEVIYMKNKIILIGIFVVCLLLSGCSNSQPKPTPTPTSEVIQPTVKPNIFDYDLLERTDKERKQYLIDQISIQNCNLMTVKYLGESENQGNIKEFLTAEGRTLFTSKYTESSSWGNIYGVGYTLQLNRWIDNDIGAEVLIYYDGEIPSDGNLDNVQIKAIIYPGIFYDSYSRTMPTVNQLKDRLTTLNTALAEYINSLENPQILNFEEAIVDIIVKSGLGGFSKTQIQHNNFYYSNEDYVFSPEDFIVIREGEQIQYIQFHISMMYKGKNYGKIVYSTDGFIYASNGLPLELYRGFMTPATSQLSTENRIEQAIEQFTYENCSLLYGQYPGNESYYKDIVQLRTQDDKLYTLSKMWEYAACWYFTPGQGNTLRYFPLADGDETIVILYEGQLPEDGNLDKILIKFVYCIEDYFDGRKINDTTLNELKQYFDDYNNAIKEYVSQIENQSILSFDEAITSVAKELNLTDLERYIGYDGQPVYANDEYTLKSAWMETLVPGSTTNIGIEFSVSVYKDNKLIKSYRCLANGKIMSNSYS